MLYEKIIRELESHMPDERVPRTGGPHMAKNLSAVEDLDVLSSSPITFIVIKAPGTVEHFPNVGIKCSEHLYKFSFIILPLEMTKQN